ncbi:MAG: helix-turn-helix domain-containing protein [Firmicutes bacterium]|nr:helix-turn-helix domain-containing protein [Bacillota bacterium]
MNLAKKIQDIRKTSKLSQDKFAEKLFVTRQAVSRWETGETTPSVETLKKMLLLFNVDANSLFDLNSVCQSCGRRFESLDDVGTNEDKTVSWDYCTPCFDDGKFYADCGLEEWVDICLQYLDDQSEEGRKSFREQLLTLKRWNKV